MGGATCRQLLQKLPTDPADIARDDCTLVFCMLNEVSGDKNTKFSEASSAGQDVIDLCHHLLKLSRPMLAIGGASDIWSYSNTA